MGKTSVFRQVQTDFVNNSDELMQLLNYICPGKTKTFMRLLLANIVE
jgi:hypothetical protein